KVKPTVPAYSSFGFAVLGQAVAAARKEFWGDAVRARLLEPLGLRDTRMAWGDADADRLAPGHNQAGLAANWDFLGYAPAGSMVSTSRDLARLVRAMLDPSPGLAPAVALALRGQAPGADDGQGFGLGWILEKRGAAQIAWHSGAT